MKAVPARRSLDGLVVGPCLADERMAQPLQWESCPYLPVPGQGRAVEQRRLAFRSGDALIEASPCAPKPGGRFLPLTETAQGCPLVHDWQAGRSHERTRFVFDAGKGAIETTPCLEREDRALVHRRAACVPLAIQLARAGLVRIPTERIEGVAEGRSVVVRDCHPVAGAAVATAQGPATVAIDAEACRGTMVDGAGESYQTLRYRLAWPGRIEPEPATNCLADVARAFRHTIEDAGWRHDEARRESTGLDQVMVRIGDAERKVGRPTPRTASVPWRMEAVEAVETGTAETLGCAIIRHARYRSIYARPDGTTMPAWLGPAESIVDARGCR